MPPKIKKEFYVEIAEPVTKIFNSILQSGIYPKQWLVEYVTPIKKTKLAETEDDLRPISLTSDLSRDFNKFLAEWLLSYIKDKLDTAQMGGLKGKSITHYLVLFYHFIVSNLDRQGPNPSSILAAYIDFKKGFNLISHSLIITRLAEWNVPSWLLRIVASYLTGRYMIVRHNGTQSTPHLLPGGLAQGDEVGQILFLVAVAGAGIANQPPAALPSPSPPLPPPAITKDELRLKFVDDLTLGEVVNLKHQLAPAPPYDWP